jgi:hypothetical protein
MTPRQITAFTAPCFRAFETIADDFREVLRFKGETWSTILTVNK